MSNVGSLLSQYREAKEKLEEVAKKVNLVAERKIQQTHGGTFFVCLPKEWASKVGLQKGDKVVLVWSKDDTLTIVV